MHRSYLYGALITIIGVLVLVIIWGWYQCVQYPMPITTVYIVRHAEKANASADPPLSTAGLARAEELARLLGDEGIDAIYVTQFQRTQQTGAALAAAENLTVAQYPANDTQGLASTILSNHTSGRMLVVGHSNTVDDIAAALGATGLSDLGDDQFDRLFVVHRFASKAHLDRLRYGAATP